MNDFWIKSSRPTLRQSRSEIEKHGSNFCSYRLFWKSLVPLMILAFGIEFLSVHNRSVNEPPKVPLPPQHKKASLKRNHNAKPKTKEKKNTTTAEDSNFGNEFNITLSKKWVKHLKTLSDFPKVVHIIWPNKNIMDESYEMLEHGVKNLRRLNPDWEFRVHDYDDIQTRIENFRHPDIPESMTAMLKDAHIVEKTDAFRVLLIYEEGGLYVDIDRVMNRKLSEALGDLTKVKYVAPIINDKYIGQDLYGSSPKNKLFLNVYKRQCKIREKMERRNGWISKKDEYVLLNVHFASMELDLFGRRIDNEDEKLHQKEWEEARHVMTRDSEGTILTMKDNKCDGLLVTYYEECPKVSRESLYKAYNVTPWQRGMDENWNRAEREKRKQKLDRLKAYFDDDDGN